MISPHGHNEKHLHELSRRLERHPGGIRPAPRGGTVWWAIKAAALVGLILFSCVGFAGALQSRNQHCHDLGRRACLSLVADDLLNGTAPARPAD